MADYTPHTQEEIAQMLAKVGLNSLEQLYRDVPEGLMLKEDQLIEKGLSEYQVKRQLTELSKQNFVYDTVLRGAGIYDHIIPSAVKYLSSLPEFVTAYTPYQPEISQGVLQVMFEYQTQMCMLTGMDVSNASVYDGATAVAEAVTMCCDKKNKVIVAGQLNPQYMAVVRTYAKGRDFCVEFCDAGEDGLVDLDKLNSQIDDQTACVVAQSPNYYGLVEDMAQIGALTKNRNVKFVYVFNPIAAVLLPTPYECGADVAVGEGQQMGLPMADGGATLGIMTCCKSMERRLPGRIVGMTKDSRGNRCFVLTLQAREQHIRREKASSSICSNQALNALTASAYISLMGKQGMIDVAQQCLDKAHYLADKLVESGGRLVYKGEFFNEFVTEGNPTLLNAVLKVEGILGGVVAPKGALWCVTEKADKAKLDLTAKIFAEVV